MVIMTKKYNLIELFGGVLIEFYCPDCSEYETFKSKALKLEKSTGDFSEEILEVNTIHVSCYCDSTAKLHVLLGIIQSELIDKGVEIYA